MTVKLLGTVIIKDQEQSENIKIRPRKRKYKWLEDMNQLARCGTQIDRWRGRMIWAKGKIYVGPNKQQGHGNG